MNIKSAIIDGASILRKKFISSANLDSEILMAEAIKKKREFLQFLKNFVVILIHLEKIILSPAGLVKIFLNFFLFKDFKKYSNTKISASNTKNYFLYKFNKNVDFIEFF